MKAIVRYALNLCCNVVWTEGLALLALEEAEQKLELTPETARLLRQAIASHFEPVAATLRDPSAGEAFCEGEQAPPTPITAWPPARSDAGFELDEVGPV